MPSGAFSVHIDERQLKDLEQLTDSLGGRAANRALSRAINRTLGVKSGGMRKTIADEIRRTANIRRSYLYKQTGRRTIRTFDISRATTQTPTGKISTQGPNIPLIEYSNQRGARSHYAKKIYVRVQKSRGRHRLQHAFIPTLRSGHRGIFVRANPGAKGKEGRKIKQLFSSRVPDVLVNTPVMNRVLRTGQDRFERELTHEIDYILKYNK
jgi:hypothetical protein